MQTETVLTAAPASTDAPSPVAAPTPLAAWFARLGLSGKILAFAALAGIIVAFLPLVSYSISLQMPVSIQMPGLKGLNQPVPSSSSNSQTTLVVEKLAGQLGLVGYLAALVLAFVLYPPNGLGQKSLCWAGVGTGLLVALLALWQLIAALNAGGDLMGMVKITPGVGAFLNVAAAIAVAAGAFLKTREEKLI
jgi:hypothetical protein